MTDVGGRTPVAELIASLTRKVADFPKPGIQFKDLTPVFADATAMTAITGAVAELASGADLVAGIEARGFGGSGRRRPAGHGRVGHPQGREVAAAGARRAVRPEYGTATLEIPGEGIDLRGRHIVIVDDVLATGGTLAASARLLERAGANVVAAAVLFELGGLGGRDAVAPLPVHSLMCE